MRGRGRAAYLDPIEEFALAADKKEQRKNK
jgi:hypothetical protein